MQTPQIYVAGSRRLIGSESRLGEMLVPASPDVSLAAAGIGLAGKIADVLTHRQSCILNRFEIQKRYPLRTSNCSSETLFPQKQVRCSMSSNRSGRSARSGARNCDAHRTSDLHLRNNIRRLAIVKFPLIALEGIPDHELATLVGCLGEMRFGWPQGDDSPGVELHPMVRPARLGSRR